MEYNYMNLTISICGRGYFYRVKNNRDSYIIDLNNIIDKVYKYAGDDFGIILEDDIQRQIEENKGDEDYTPFPTLEMFKELGEELVFDGVEVFPMRYQFEGLRDFVDYLRKFPLEIVRVERYNKYVLESDRLFRVLHVEEFCDDCYSLIYEIQDVINDDDLYNELDAINTNQDETIALNEINQTLTHYGYKLTEMIP